MMTYDRDLKRARLALWAMMAANLGMGYANARSHEWLIVATCLVWAGNCLIFGATVRIQQRTRDEQRLVVSMMHPPAEDR